MTLSTRSLHAVRSLAAALRPSPRSGTHLDPATQRRAHDAVALAQAAPRIY